MKTIIDETYNQYPGQTSPQPAYIEVDPRDGGTILATWDAEIGNAVPTYVWDRAVRRFDIPPEISEADLRNLITHITPDAEIVSADDSTGEQIESAWGRIEETIRCWDPILLETYSVLDWVQDLSAPDIVELGESWEDIRYEIESDIECQGNIVSGNETEDDIRDLVGALCRRNPECIDSLPQWVRKALELD